jgi:hypothetical protein
MITSSLNVFSFEVGSFLIQFQILLAYISHFKAMVFLIVFRLSLIDNFDELRVFLYE